MYELTQEERMILSMVDDACVDVVAQRAAEIDDEPCAVVAACGAEVVEMERTREKSFCCGAGGGHMWLEERAGERMNVQRTEQALATGVDAVAHGLPVLPVHVRGRTGFEGCRRAGTGHRRAVVRSIGPSAVIP